MEHGRGPLVSVGVPVYNGEAGIGRALDGLLRQDYANLQIVISDNASTDSTPEICRRYAELDGRVKYVRSDRNRGSSWNFNRVLELSSGEYFMWAAHDDVRDPGFVSKCVAKLEREPDAVLCQSRTAMFIEGNSELLCTAHLDSFNGITDVVARYQETLKRFPATAFYGVYRTSAVRKTKVFQREIATDVAFIQELSIQGRFIQVPEVLFHYFGRPRWNTVDQDYRAIFGVDRKPWWYLPFVVLFRSHWTRIASAAIPMRTKVRLWGVLLRHELGQSMLKVAIKAGRLSPDVWKERLGRAIYWRWMHSPNVEVACEALFVERVIKPKIGWWR
jgi:glycosyltransferase involved in cell wall biosynthesis